MDYHLNENLIIESGLGLALALSAKWYLEDTICHLPVGQERLDRLAASKIIGDRISATFEQDSRVRD